MRYFAMVLVFMLVGCVTPIKPQSVDQQIAQAEGTLTGVYSLIATFSEQGRLDRAEHDEAMEAAREAEALLLLSRDALVAGDESGALEELRRAQRLLLLLEQRLMERESSVESEGVWA